MGNTLIFSLLEFVKLISSFSLRCFLEKPVTGCKTQTDQQLILSLFGKVSLKALFKIHSYNGVVLRQIYRVVRKKHSE